MALSIYQLVPTNAWAPPFYLRGVPRSLIIAANSTAEARTIALTTAGPHDGPAWNNPTMATCRVLTPTTAGLIARDYPPDAA